MTGYTYDLGRVVAGVQLVLLTHHQFDENDYHGRIFDGTPPECPALIDGAIVDAPQAVKDVLAAESQAADLATNATRYTLQNQYLSLCDQLTGQTTHAKLGFAELQAIIAAMMDSAPNQAVALSLQLLTLNAALVREGGVNWWDQCKWVEL